MRSAKRRFKNVFFLFFYFKTLSIHFFLYVLCYKTKRVTVSKYLGPVLYSFVEKKKQHRILTDHCLSRRIKKYVYRLYMRKTKKIIKNPKTLHSNSEHEC